MLTTNDKLVDEVLTKDSYMADLLVNDNTT